MIECRHKRDVPMSQIRRDKYLEHRILRSVISLSSCQRDCEFGSDEWSESLPALLRGLRNSALQGID